MNNEHDFEIRQRKSIPVKIVFSSMLGGMLVPLGLFFFLFGLLFVFLTGIPTALRYLPFAFGAPTEQTLGTIVSVTSTNSKVNGQRVYKLVYSYTADNKHQNGAVFTTGAFSNPTANNYQVRYLKSSPGISELTGFRSTETPLFFMLLVLIFPVVGIIIFTIGVRNTFKTIQILTHAKKAKATIIGIESTNMSLNRQTFFKITFRFTNQTKETIEASMLTLSPELFKKDSEHEILYNSRNPNQLLAQEEQSSDIKAWIQQNVV